MEEAVRGRGLKTCPGVRDGGKECYAWESPPQVRLQVRLFSCLGRKAEYRGPEAWKIIGGS